MVLKDFLRSEQAIKGSREARVHRHLHDRFDYLVAAKPHVKPGGNMDFKLGRCIAHRGQGGYGCNLTGTCVQARA